MNIFSKIGIIVVNFALISYSIAIITEQVKKLVTNRVLTFLTIGIILDFTATAFMILGSKNPPFSLHGILGYSSLLGMFIDTILIWKFYYKNPVGTLVPKKLHKYSLAAYLWWIAAFITGGLLVAMR